MPFTMSFHIYLKWKLDYSIFLLHIQFFLNSLEFQVNQKNIHPTLTILKVVLALKGTHYFVSFFFFGPNINARPFKIWKPDSSTSFGEIKLQIISWTSACIFEWKMVKTINNCFIYYFNFYKLIRAISFVTNKITRSCLFGTRLKQVWMLKTIKSNIFWPFVLRSSSENKKGYFLTS